MAEETETESEEPKKGGKLGLIIGLVLALACGGGGFFAVYSGMILGPSDTKEQAEEKHEELPAVAFVPIEPMIISLGENANKQLRFRAELEVDPARQGDVSSVMPRILDVLNGYLRAVELAELQNPAALIRLRGQMLRRVQLVTGKGSVRDLLITEFVFG